MCAGAEPGDTPVHPNCNCRTEWIDDDGSVENISATDAFDNSSEFRQETLNYVDDALRAVGISRDALVDEIMDVAQTRLEEGRLWYAEAKTWSRRTAIANDLSQRQVAGMISATSPRTPWGRNQFLVERVAKNYRNYGDLSAAEAAKQIGGGMSKCLEAAVRIARGEDVKTVLTGWKRENFYNNIILPGQTKSVTVDAWMQEAIVRTSGMTKEQALKLTGQGAAKLTGQSGGGAGYVAVADAVRQVALVLGETPDTVQSAYWIALRGGAN